MWGACVAFVWARGGWVLQMASLSSTLFEERLSTKLDSLHQRSLEEATASWSAENDGFFADKYVALDADKAKFMYLLARSKNIQHIVEAGTSFGVSTIWLAAAVRDNVQDYGVSQGVAQPFVIGTEKEAHKVEQAKKNIQDAFGDTLAEKVRIDIRLGDLKETLARDLPLNTVELLLLDIWTPLALPALKLVLPSLKRVCLHNSPVLHIVPTLSLASGRSDFG